MKNGWPYPMTSPRHVTILLLSVLSVSLGGSRLVGAQSPVSEYRGTCDASAAVSLGADHFIVANDEDNNLRIYRLGRPDPVMVFDLDSFAEADPDKPEMDIEGAARIGNRIYWITSHGTNKNGKYRESRRRFFATDFGFENGRPWVKPAGRAYANLLDDMDGSRVLKKYKLAEAAELAPKDEGGLNIEGLADTPEGALLIGFRSPLPGGNALIVSIDNPGDVIQGKKPLIGSVLEISLGGLGIRSIERDGERYLIVAGPRNGEGEFRLFHWQGPGAAAKPRPDSAVKFEDFHTEALFVLADGRAYVLSDDGGKDINGIDCKELPAEEHRFRATTIKP